MKKLLIFSVFVLGVLTLSACDQFKADIDPAAISAETEASVLSAFQGTTPSGMLAASTTAKTTKGSWDGTYSISGSVLCKYTIGGKSAGIANTTVPLETATFAVSNNKIIDSSLKKQVAIDAKGKATVTMSQNDKASGIKTAIAMVYQFSKTGVTGKVTMTVTIPSGEQTVLAKCTGTASGKKK